MTKREFCRTMRQVAFALSVALGLGVISGAQENPGTAGGASQSIHQEAPGRPGGSAKPPRPGEPLDLNKASQESLIKKLALTEAQAKAIISHRPYTKKSDLVKQKVISMALYRRIENQIIVY